MFYAAMSTSKGFDANVYHHNNVGDPRLDIVQLHGSSILTRLELGGGKIYPYSQDKSIFFIDIVVRLS